MDEKETTIGEVSQPIIINLGRQKPKNIKALKKGEGKLWEEVEGVVEEVQEMLGEKANGKVLIPVVMIYEKKSTSRGLPNMFFPYLRGKR